VAWLNPYGHAVIFSIVAYIAALLDNLWMALLIVSVFSCVQLTRLYKVCAKQDIFGLNQDYEANLAYACLGKFSKRRGVKGEKSKWEDNAAEKVELRLVDLAESYKNLKRHGNTEFIFILYFALCPIFLLALKHQKGL